ncbi:SDR family NAD(P)-dependent oxidoreductase [Amycolatopsis jejuensis]|uniref:SDR family NAD(P)-dependent oxidoreductase n=1 Tax=Amycolatopsis jejuensis TaxID=330084 RepID=UPI0005254A9F|nr:SDR family oxidoreductase [Amycolatopsis jejuensis]
MTDDLRYPELRGKNVLVTGGSRGIGEATVRDFAAVGANVFFNYRASSSRSDELVAELGKEHAAATQADLADLSDVERLWEEAVSWKGGIDVVVHNASVREPIPLDAPTSEWDEHWLSALRVNLVAPAHLSRFAIKHFLGRGCQGVIIGLTGRIAVRGDYPEYLQDGAAKGGLNSMLRGIASGFAKNDILTYLISGGIIETDQARSQFDAQGGRERYMAEIPMGEFGTVQDISELILFLSTGRARYSTGSTIDATGASFLH